MSYIRFSAILFVGVSLLGRTVNADDIEVLFLGDNGHHRPSERFAQLRPVLAKRGITLSYTDKVSDLNPATLKPYDGLMIYANIDEIAPDQEKALLGFVADGKGLIALHCASYCFRNSPKYVALVGAQFQRHGTGTFQTHIVQPDHPIMAGFGGFESWDETYVHHQHNAENRVVLSVRDGRSPEPWTWVRTHGEGRVFYTAWGHDHRTWGSPGFQNLIERGVRWAIGGDPSDAGNYLAEAAFPVPEMTTIPKGLEPFQYKPAKIAFYPPGGRSQGDGEWNRMQLPLSPAESQKHYVTPVGFRMELFAAEPDIGKPLCMNWDEQGRLWIVETVDYPNDKQPRGQGNDRIRICEDTDGDGKADKFTVFADKLSIPTSLLFSNGGVIVHHAPETIFLKDTNGDDKADVRKVLFTGWSVYDTHAGPSNLRYGLDNWIWGVQGYAGFRGQVGGEDHRFSMGIYRFTPDASKLEFLRSTDNNTWGLGFTEDGLVVASTANRNPSVYMPIPNRYYESVRGWSAEQLRSAADTHLFKPITENVRQVDHHGGYTAAAGHAVYTARSYPREYWNQTAFVTGPTGHLVGTFVLKRRGADVATHNPFNLAASDDEWSAPTMAEIGPDGQVWVIDWYNYIVQHNPTPAGYKTGKGNAYETDLRDKKHGRIYRVVYDDSATKPMTLKDAGPEKLVATLKDPNMFWRLHAQRLLVERGDKDVAAGLVDLIQDPSVDQAGLNVGAIHALWTLHGLNAIDGEAETAVSGALAHRSLGVRRNAVAVLPRTAASIKTLLEARLLHDKDPQVRLAALLALSEMPADKQAASALIEFASKQENVSDRWLLDGLTSASAQHSTYFLPMIAESKPSGDELGDLVRVVSEHYGRGGPVDSVADVLLAAVNADSDTTDLMLAGLAEGWPVEKQATLPDDVEEELINALPKLSIGAQGDLVRLGSSWGARRFEAQAQRVVNKQLANVADASKPSFVRVAAAKQLVAFQPMNADLPGKLLDLAGPSAAPAVITGILEALQQSRAPSVGTELLDRIDQMTPVGRQAAMRVLVARQNLSLQLLDAIAQGGISASDLSLEQKQALLRHPAREVRRQAREVLSKEGGIPNPDRQKVLASLMPLTKQTGDAARGKEVFKKNCANCHMHSGEGKKVGPDLTGMSVHPKHELLTHIIDPSRSVEGNFRAYSVLTSEGVVLTGMLASETRTSIELFDSEGKQHVILREDIEQLKGSAKSVMPEGFEKQVKEHEIADLLEFLTAKGKYVPLPLAKAATAISTKGLFHSGDNGPDRIIFSDWGPKEFKGIPFQLVDPRDKKIPNMVLLYGPRGSLPPQMPRSVSLPCNTAAKSIHLLSGISGWGYPAIGDESVSMIVRLHYADGATEDHELRNGVHFADYIRRVDVPGSEFAFNLRGQQLRYLAVHPQRPEVIEKIEFVKGSDASAPMVLAATVETRH